VAPRVGLVPERYLPPTSEILGALADELQEPSFWVALGDTLEGWAIGLGLALVAGIGLGLLIGSVPALRAATASTIEFLRPIPSVAPDPVAMDTAHSYRLGRWARIRHVVWPTTLPSAVAGFRLAAAVALVLAITAELIIGSPGLGKEIAVAQTSGAVPVMHALVVVTGLLRVTSTWLVDDVLPSVVRLLAGFAVATVVGVGLGVAIGSSPRRRAALEPVLEFLGPSRRRSWCRSSSACGTWCCGRPARRSSPGCARRCRSASS